MFFYILFLFLHKKISLIVSFFFFFNFRYFIFCQYCRISLLYSLAQLSFSLFVAILGYFLAKSSAKLEQFLVLVPNKKTFAFFLLIITNLGWIYLSVMATVSEMTCCQNLNHRHLLFFVFV